MNHSWIDTYSLVEAFSSFLSFILVHCFRVYHLPGFIYFFITIVTMETKIPKVDGCSSLTPYVGSSWYFAPNFFIARFHLLHAVRYGTVIKTKVVVEFPLA